MLSAPLMLSRGSQSQLPFAVRSAVLARMIALKRVPAVSELASPLIYEKRLRANAVLRLAVPFR